MAKTSFIQKWLAASARSAVRREKPFVIAMTGAVGKSTAKQACAALLEAAGRKSEFRASRKNYNNELGVPLTVLDLPAPGRSPVAWLRTFLKSTAVRFGLLRTCPKILVMEMGADKPGDLAYLTELVRPDVAIVTAVTPERSDLAPVHLANYPSIDALAEEKSTLVKALKKEGIAILNADDPRTFAMRHLTDAHVLTFGEADGSDVQILQKRILTEDGPYGKEPVGLEIVFEQYSHRYHLTVPGVFGTSVAYALASAIALCEALDCDESALRELPQHFSPMPGRVRILSGIKHTTLFDDSYNASPAAVLASLRDLASVETAESQRKIACLGEMRELGEQSESLHRMVGAEAARLGLDFLAVCGIFSHAMAEGALANGMTEDQVKIFEDTPEAGLFLQEYIRPGDIILAKASEGARDTKGVRMERVIKELMAEPLRAPELLVRQESAWKRK